MSMELDWGDLEETFLIWKFTSKWTSEDFFNALLHLDDLTRTGEKPVALIVDVRFSISSPTNLMSLVRTAMQRKFVNIEQVIVINQSKFWFRIFDIVRSTLDYDLTTPVQFVNTVEEAYKLLDVEA